MIACRKMFTDTLVELARQDKDIIAVTTDARGSVTLGDFADQLPEQFVECDKVLRGIPLSNMYQHEYREIDEFFPYPMCTLSQLGIPANDVLHVLADGQDYYLEMVA